MEGTGLRRTYQRKGGTKECNLRPEEGREDRKEEQGTGE